MKEEKFPHNRKPSHRHVRGKLWNLRGQHNNNKKYPEYAPNCNSSASSKWGLGRQAWAAFGPKGRAWLECPEDNLRALM